MKKAFVKQTFVVKAGALLFALAALVALGILGAPYLAAPEKKAPAPAAVPAGNGLSLRFAEGAPQLAYLHIEAAAAYPLPLLEALSGRLTYDDNVTARVFSPVAGRVLKIPVQAGDRVRAGQPLLTLDVPDYADLRKAESERMTKRAAFERAKVLFENEVVARKDFEAAENELRAANAEVERSQARLRSLTPLAGQAGFALRAPLAGIVTERQASPAMEVRPDQANPLFVVSDPTRLWAIVELPEKDLAKLRVGQTVNIEVDAYPERRFAGQVLAIGDVLDAQSRRVPVRCAVRNDERLLKPEMFARITPESEGEKLPRVPNTALVTEGLHVYIFVEKAPGLIEKREVRLSFRGHTVSFVGSGLRAGERVVTTGALLLNAELGGG